MLKEAVALMFALWCSQASPAPVTNKYSQRLDGVYCSAESLFRKYAKGRILPSGIRLKMERMRPGLGSIKESEKAEPCKAIQGFHGLFQRLSETIHKDHELTSIVTKFENAVRSQKSYLSDNCGMASIQAGAISHNYSNHDATRHNELHYVFELYKNRTLHLLPPKDREQIANSPEVCGENY